jgi:diguanylate cyclase (GGDEF)-like protein
MGKHPDPLPTSVAADSLGTLYFRLSFYLATALLAVEACLAALGAVPEGFDPLKLGIVGSFALAAAIGAELESNPAGASRTPKGWFLAFFGLIQVGLCIKTGGTASPYFILVASTVVFAGLSLTGVRTTYVATGIAGGYVLGTRFLVETRAGVTTAEGLVALFMNAAFLIATAILSHRVGRRQRTEVKTLAVQSVQDPLTSLDNRRGFLQKMEGELQRAERFNWPVAMLMLDIDHFKKLNDVHGHAAGDQALIEVARLLRENVGTLDHIARVGGEEFAVAVVAAEPYHGRDLADRIVRAFRARDWSRIRPGLTATVSVGVAVLPPSQSGGDPHEVISQLMQRADRALYVVKQNGRDGFHVAGSETTPAAPTSPIPMAPIRTT